MADLEGITQEELRHKRLREIEEQFKSDYTFLSEYGELNKNYKYLPTEQDKKVCVDLVREYLNTIHSINETDIFFFRAFAHFSTGVVNNCNYLDDLLPKLCDLSKESIDSLNKIGGVIEETAKNKLKSRLLGYTGKFSFKLFKYFKGRKDKRDFGYLISAYDYNDQSASLAEKTDNNLIYSSYSHYNAGFIAALIGKGLGRNKKYIKYAISHYESFVDFFDSTPHKPAHLKEKLNYVKAQLVYLERQLKPKPSSRSKSKRGNPKKFFVDESPEEFL